MANKNQITEDQPCCTFAKCIRLQGKGQLVMERQPVPVEEAVKNLNSSSSLPPAAVFSIAEGYLSHMN